MDETTSSTTTCSDDSKAHHFHGEGLTLQNGFQEWWDFAREYKEPPTPLEFLTHFGIHETVVRSLLWDTLSLWCPPTATRIDAGAIDYFAHYSKDALKGDWGNEAADIFNGNPLEEAIKARPGSAGGPSDQDVMTLMEIVPPEDWTDWSDILEACLSSDCSENLHQFLFGKFPDTFRNSIMSAMSFYIERESLDHTTVRAISLILPKIKGLEIRGGGFQMNALLELLDMVLQNKNLTQLSLEVPEDPEFYAPNDWVDPNEDVNAGVSTVAAPSTLSCSLQSFELHLSCERHRSSLLALSTIEHMPRLTKLKVYSRGFPFALASPALIHALQTKATLRELVVSAQENGSNIQPLLRVMDELKENSNMTSFTYRGINPMYGGYKDKYEEKLLEVLQDHNTTLTEVKLNGYHSACPRLDYFTTLNAKGRATARNPDTNLKDFVDLLYPDKSINVLYGLLRELPTTWSGAVRSPYETRSLCSGNKKPCPSDNRRRSTRKRRKTRGQSDGSASSSELV